MKFLNINASETVKLTNKLEKLHRSAMPIAVRSTLNDAAFMARKLIIKNFKSNFIIRNRTFISSHTAANRCQNTFDINRMQSDAGIIKGKTGAGDLLIKQEDGGTISRRRIPSDNVRQARANRRLVNKNQYAKKLIGFKNGIIYRSSESTIVKNDKGIWRIFKGYNKKTGKGRIERWYTFNRSITITKHPFVDPASSETATKIESIFEKNAQKQFAKYLNK